MRNERSRVVGLLMGREPPPMNMMSVDPHPTDLDYVPPRAVSFGWIGEALNLFGARALLWMGASALTMYLPVALFYGLDFALGDPMQVFIAFTGGRPRTPGVGQYVLLSVLSLALGVVSLFFIGGLLRMAVRQVRGLPIATRDVAGGGRVFGPLLGFSLVFWLANTVLALACFAPLIFEVVGAYSALFGTAPGPAPHTVVWLWVWGSLGTVLYLIASAVLLALLLPAFALLADGVGVIASWRRSVAAMRRQWLLAAVFLSLLSVIYIVASIVPLALGLLVFLPVLCLVPALAYRDMIGMPGRVWPPPPDYGPAQEGVWPPPPAIGQTPPTAWGPPPPEKPPS